MVVLTAVFDEFRQHLDDFNDRRERLVKVRKAIQIRYWLPHNLQISRDVTSLSKKIIFLLHRVPATNAPGASVDPNTQQARAKLPEIRALFALIVKDISEGREDDNNATLHANFHRHHQQITPGLQEYIEAISFLHYLEKGCMIPWEAVQADVAPLPVTPSDYVLGLSDLTGELMRLAITGLSSPGGRQRVMGICRFVRECRADFQRLVPYIYGLGKKQSVTNQSLQKIEDGQFLDLWQNPS